jgi:hypothetical protein
MRNHPQQNDSRYAAIDAVAFLEESVRKLSENRAVETVLVASERFLCDLDQTLHALNHQW